MPLSGIDYQIGEAENTMSIYPNPFNNHINIDYGAQSGGQAVIRLYDMTGRQVLSKTVNTIAGNNNLKLETQNLKPGVYLLKIGNDEGNVGRQLIKME